jgi:Pyruvate/2-oxoacid:ferredoxin oxidoreductase gamma subunit
MEDDLTDEQKKDMDVYLKEIEKKDAIRKGKSVIFNTGMTGAGWGSGHGNASSKLGVK